MPGKGGSPEEWFWEKVDKSDECWRWLGAIRSGGYGLFSYQGKLRGAHVVSWMISRRRRVPRGKVIRHIPPCQYRDCVNPSHLRLGTYSDNMRDMWDRRRERTRVSGS